MARVGDMFPSRYLKADDLDGRAIAVTISEVKAEPVGHTRELKYVVYFEGKSKGLTLNKTCAKKIAEIAGSDDTAAWPGTRVVLFATEVEFQGELVPAIRIKAPAGADAGGRAASVSARPRTVSTDLDADDIGF